MRPATHTQTRAEERDAPHLQVTTVFHLREAEHGTWVRITGFDGNPDLEQALMCIGFGIGSCGKVYRQPTSIGSLLIEKGRCSLVVGRNIADRILVEILE